MQNMVKKNVNSCAFTGHRPHKFPWKYAEDDPRCLSLKQTMYAEIERLAAAGVYHFFSGMALGVDLWASQMVLDLRSTYPNLILHCILPCERQEVKWPEKKQEVYRDILRKADSIEYISQEYYNGCMLDRNRKLVSSSEILLAVYNGEQRGGTAATVRYARQAGREIIIIDPNTL
jgi:uncharacterized phage-like protein YoqJ